MAAIEDRVWAVIQATPGLSDKDIADKLGQKPSVRQQVNQAARLLESKGKIKRVKGSGDVLRNYPMHMEVPGTPASRTSSTNPKQEDNGQLSEDSLKKHIQVWLEKDGWKTAIAWGKKPGADIVAEKGRHIWIIEVKGIGSLNAMRVNYFLAMLGEILQRMNNPQATYSVAMPDIQQYRNLWARLPELAKKRTRITALFVDSSGAVSMSPEGER